jgi:GT2 family glycosyltransferase
MDKMSNGLVSIVIVTAGVKDYLKSLLDSLSKQTYPVLETIIIDNSLNPGLKALPGWVKLYRSKENLFYCQALNIGIRDSKGDFILCLNDDVVLDSRFIEEALKGFLIHPRIGMVSGKILRSDKKTLDSTGLYLSIWRTAKERGYGLSDKKQFEKEGYIFGVNGAIAFYRRKMLEEIKIEEQYFDIDYRIFYDDLDISWRAQNFGWKAYYVPGAVAYHARGVTVRQCQGVAKPYARRYLNDELHADLIKNRYLTFIKNEPLPSLILHLPSIILYDFLAWSYVLLLKPAVAKKVFLNIKYLRAALRKRRLIKGREKVLPWNR